MLRSLILRDGGVVRGRFAELAVSWKTGGKRRRAAVCMPEEKLLKCGFSFHEIPCLRKLMREGIPERISWS